MKVTASSESKAYGACMPSLLAYQDLLRASLASGHHCASSSGMTCTASWAPHCTERTNERARRPGRSNRAGVTESVFLLDHDPDQGDRTASQQRGGYVDDASFPLVGSMESARQRAKNWGVASGHV